ncbi:MAG: hypothetical protein ACREJC_17715 [Tepidisphaeraceae bacterium]
MAQKGPITGAAVRNTPPDANDWGLVVRPIFAGPIIVIANIAGPTTGVTTTIAASAVPSVYLAANPARLGATINNDSAGRFLYIKLGAGVGLASYSVRLGPHSYYELPFPAYVGVIEGVWGPGVGGFATVTELT